MDVEWSGAVAPGANIILVVAEDTETALGVDLAAQHIVDNNLAPILSESWGVCELGLGTAGNQFFNQLWQQASAQGITVLVASGDSGSAVCDSDGAKPPAPAKFGLAVSGFASTPYNTTVGGTDFLDLTNASAYWNTSNASSTRASAKSYIPETTWNDSCTNLALAMVSGYSTNAETNCNMSILAQYDVFTLGGSGGRSGCTTSNGQTVASCSGGYSKPSWQTAISPADGKRDVPDVSLFAATGMFSGSFYIICEADAIQSGTSCNPNDSSTQFLGASGTSASTPAMAGIMALVEQKVGSRLGNANYVLYKLAAQQTNSSCNSSTGSGSACIFNDITTGTNAMPCATGSPNCTTTTSGDQYGVLSGYSATAGYDLATGLGSVNAANLVSKWTAITLTPSATTLTSLTPTTITHGQTVNFGVSVAPQSGTGTPTGTVSLMTSLASNGNGVGSALLSSGSASGTTAALPGGTYNVTAHYAGDGTFASSDSTPVSVTVNKENSTTQVGLVALNVVNGQVVSTTRTNNAVYGSLYFLRADVTGSACPSTSVADPGCPTGNVTVTDNGSPLDGGTFALNSAGYMEDQNVQLSGGAHAVMARYAGDNSFNASSATSTVSITPASTTMAAPLVYGAVVGNVNPIQLDATVQSSGFGAAPSGTIAFFVNGTQVSGNENYSPTSGQAGGQPLLAASMIITANLFPSAGKYTVTAVYSGDANYQPVNSPATTLNLKFGTPSLDLVPPTDTVTAGQGTTISAIIEGANSRLAPTGTVTFVSGVTQLPVPGNTVYSTVIAADGNASLKGSLTFNPAYSDRIAVNYGGDANYPSFTGFGTIVLTVQGNDFSLALTQTPSVTINSPGTYQQAIIAVAGQSNYNGTINFNSGSCAGLPREAQCNFESGSITGSGFIGVDISTQGPHAIARPGGGLPARTNQSLVAAFGISFAGFFLLGSFPRKRLQRALSLAGLVVLAIALVSCGGGGFGGGGGSSDPGTPAGTYTVTITGTSGSLTHSVSFPLTVN